MGNSILGPTSSINISTGGWPVVPDKNFSQPVSAFKITLTSVPDISKSSRTSNNFAVPVRQSNLLNTSYDRDVPTHLSKEFDRLHLHDPPFVPQSSLLCSNTSSGTRRVSEPFVFVAWAGRRTFYS